MKKEKYLGSRFWKQKTLKVAEDLVGCFLVRKIGRKTLKFKITETEAYIGPHDLACHSARGRTRRTEVMFEEGGKIYIYFVYGMHYMLNIVTEKKDHASAVLIRGVETVNGPGRVAKLLKIDKKLNGKNAELKNGLWFEKRKRGEKIYIKKSPRIGVDYAGPIWSKKHYRFNLAH